MTNHNSEQQNFIFIQPQTEPHIQEVYPPQNVVLVKNLPEQGKSQNVQVQEIKQPLFQNYPQQVFLDGPLPQNVLQQPSSLHTFYQTQYVPVGMVPPQGSQILEHCPIQNQGIRQDISDQHLSFTQIPQYVTTVVPIPADAEPKNTAEELKFPKVLLEDIGQFGDSAIIDNSRQEDTEIGEVLNIVNCEEKQKAENSFQVGEIEVLVETDETTNLDLRNDPIKPNLNPEQQFHIVNDQPQFIELQTMQPVHQPVTPQVVIRSAIPGQQNFIFYQPQTEPHIQEMYSTQNVVLVKNVPEQGESQNVQVQEIRQPLFQNYPQQVFLEGPLPQNVLQQPSPLHTLYQTQYVPVDVVPPQGNQIPQHYPIQNQGIPQDISNQHLPFSQIPQYVTTLVPTPADAEPKNTAEELNSPEILLGRQNIEHFSGSVIIIGIRQEDTEFGEIKDGYLYQHAAGRDSSASLPKFGDIVEEIELEDDVCARNRPSCSRNGPATHQEARDVDHISQNESNLSVPLSPSYEESSQTTYNEQFTTITICKNMTLTRGDEQKSKHKNCNNKFTSVSLFNSHSNPRVAKKSYECKICSNTFTKSGSLKIHSLIHTGEKPFECKICNKTFSQSNSLKSHLLIHTGDKPFQCKICNKSFSQSSSLKTHSLVHTGKKPFMCKICNKTFFTNSTLKTHSLIHTGEKPFVCKICNKTFSQSSNLKKHSLLHTGKKPFLCKICNKTFSMNSTLKTHSLIHTGGKPFECEICNKTFSQSGNLKKHLLIHTGKKPFGCKICNKTFSQSNTLKKHSLLHTGKKPFICKICNKKFSMKSYLKSHSLIHTEKKPFECKICNKTFSMNNILKKHSLAHTGEKPFECKMCNKTFAQSSNLKKHSLIHTRKKPFVCKICNKTFSRSSSLKSHSLTHTEEEPF